MSVGLKDVALKAGFSVSTTHQILTGRADRFATSTVEQVRKAAAALHYKTNVAARGLQAGKSYLLGVLVNSVNVSDASEFLGGIQAGLGGTSYVPITLTHDSVPQEIDCLKRCIDRRVDGLLINTAVYHNDQSRTYRYALSDLFGVTCPVVEVFGDFLRGTPSVQLDYEAAGRMCVETALRQGAGEVVYFTHEHYKQYASPSAPFHTTWHFSLGYNSAAEIAGFTPQVLTHPLPGNHADVMGREQMAYETFRDWASKQTSPCCVCCSDEAAAVAAVTAIRERLGPEQDQFSVVYFGQARSTINMLPWCHVVAKPVYALGRLAIESLLNQLDGDAVQSAMVAPIDPASSEAR